MRVRTGVGAVVAIGAIAILANRPGGRTADPESRSVDLARGAAIYAQACAACHGADLAGQPDWTSPDPDGRLPAPPHDATGHTWHHPDRVLLQITQLGTAAVVGNEYESNMLGFANMYSEDELWDVLAWIKTHWPDRERAYQAQVTAQDQQDK
jgi:mono/diheme cytochrome c family protein